MIATHAYTLYTLTHTNMHGHRHRHTAYVHTSSILFRNRTYQHSYDQNISGSKNIQKQQQKNTSLNLSQMTFGSSNMGSFLWRFQRNIYVRDPNMIKFHFKRLEK